MYVLFDSLKNTNMSGLVIFGVFVFFFNSPTDALRFVEQKLLVPHLQVRTTGGIVQGVERPSEAKPNGSYFAFSGIPYAHPPVGSLRFRAPKKAKNWSDVLDVSQEGAGCVEIIITGEKLIDVAGTEDCLFLNIFTKYNPRSNKSSLPVMVFIYGGGFQEGSSQKSVYGPDFLVENDIVLVTFNYRSGIFALRTEKDQNLALRWIQKNIRNFGGNPNSVTIFGQSAGSASVHYHILSPKSKGLFHKAIMQSGSALCHWGSQRKPRNKAYLLGVAHGITNPKNSYDLIERLRAVDLEDLMVSQVGIDLAAFTDGSLFGLPFAPTLEPQHKEAFITTDVWYEILKKGNFNKVPVIMGLTENEALYFTRVISAVRPLLTILDVDPGLYAPSTFLKSTPNKIKEIGIKVKNFYFGVNGSAATSSMEKLIQYISDEYFVRPIRKTGSLMSMHVPVYFYSFTYKGDLGNNGISPVARSRTMKDTTHTEELFYLFLKQNNRSVRDNDILTRKRMVKLWTNFAKYSDPTPEKDNLLQDTIWPKISSEEIYRMQLLEINETLRIKRSFKKEAAMKFWEDLFGKYYKPPFHYY